MPAGTDVRSRSDACPVCDEPLPGRPERCFRCETTLTGWWSFEEALAGIAPAAAAASPAGPAPLRRSPVSRHAAGRSISGPWRSGWSWPSPPPG